MSTCQRGAVRFHPMLRLVLPLFLACCVATAFPVVGDETPVEPTFDQYMARELPLQADRPFVAPQDLFRALLPFPLAGEPALLEEEEQVTFVLNLGTEAPVNCAAHLSGLDPAASVAAVSEASLPMGEGSQILARQIHRVDLTVVDQEIVASADWLYEVEQDGQVVTGMLKVRAADVGEGGLLCLHDEVGFSATMDRIVERLIRTWREPAEAVDPTLFREIHLLRLNDSPYALESVAISVDSDGDYVIETNSADLSPVDAQTLTGQDTYQIDYSFANGVLINSIFIISDGGELSHHLNLGPENETHWNVSGTFQSKQIQETFEHGALASVLADREELREFLSSAAIGDQLVQETWLADISPAAITELTLEYQGRQGDHHRVELAMGELVMDLKVDDEGGLVSGEAEAAGAKLELERLVVEGVFPRVSLDE